MEVGQEAPIELSESQASRALAPKSVLPSLCIGHGDFRVVEAMVVEPDDAGANRPRGAWDARRRLRKVKVAKHPSARDRKGRRSP